MLPRPPFRKKKIWSINITKVPDRWRALKLWQCVWAVRAVWLSLWRIAACRGRWRAKNLSSEGALVLMVVTGLRHQRGIRAQWEAAHAGLWDDREPSFQRLTGAGGTADRNVSHLMAQNNCCLVSSTEDSQLWRYPSVSAVTRGTN